MPSQMHGKGFGKAMSNFVLHAHLHLYMILDSQAAHTSILCCAVRWAWTCRRGNSEVTLKTEDGNWKKKKPEPLNVYLQWLLVLLFCYDWLNWLRLMSHFIIVKATILDWNGNGTLFPPMFCPSFTFFFNICIQEFA